MTISLNELHRPARTTHTQSVVVFLHGYGANKADLFPLADDVQRILPSCAIYAPNAPFAYPLAGGNSDQAIWFCIPWLDGTTNALRQTQYAASLSALQTYIDNILQKEKILPERLAILGFSQGAMLALEIALRYKSALGAIIGFSGKLLTDPPFSVAAPEKAPVFLAHGTEDSVVPFENLALADAGLSTFGFARVETYEMEGAGHTITADGLRAALDFLNRQLGE